MTTICTTKMNCPVCGARSEHRGIMSTNEIGPSDLDTRPPEMKRSTMFAWIRRCPKCGYCTSNSRAARSKAREIVSGKEYQDQLKDPAYPALAISFLCRAILERESGGYRAATWAFMCAAWVCDDAGLSEQAVACRRKAADMLKAAEARGEQHAAGAQGGADAAILVDLLRRSGRPDEARQVIAERRSGISEDIVQRVLDFQSVLLDRNDAAGHTVAEALGEEA